MTVAELKKVVTSATTMRLRLAETKSDAINDKEKKHKLTFANDDAGTWDYMTVVGIYPVRKDDLDVWVIK